jgi:hypothetical protein
VVYFPSFTTLLSRGMVQEQKEDGSNAGVKPFVASHRATMIRAMRAIIRSKQRRVLPIGGPVFVWGPLLLGMLLSVLLSACGTAVNQIQPAATVTISPGFQSAVSPLPTVPAYRCGAWSSNNAPTPHSTIFIYARLTKNLQGVSGATATAMVHFSSGDVQLTQEPVSDAGGYVRFTLSLEGRQPLNTPATVDVTFTDIPGGPASVRCSPAFFTPQ